MDIVLIMVRLSTIILVSFIFIVITFFYFNYYAGDRVIHTYYTPPSAPPAENESNRVHSEVYTTNETTEQQENSNESYMCCTGGDCNDNNESTVDICVNPCTSIAICYNTPTEHYNNIIDYPQEPPQQNVPEQSAKEPYEELGLKTCSANCDSLPVPVLKVCPITDPLCNPNNAYYIELYLDGKPLTTSVELFRFIKPSLNEFATKYKMFLVDGRGAVTEYPMQQYIHKYKFDGAYRYKILQDSFEEDGVPFVLNLFLAETNIAQAQNLTLKYQIINHTDGSGSIYLYKREGENIDQQLIFNRAKEVTTKLDGITNVGHVVYKLHILPQTIAVYLGGEGNFYRGNGIITMGYSPQFIFEQVSAETAHEYTHALEFEKSVFKCSLGNCVQGNIEVLSEGLDDGLVVYAGFKEPSALTVAGERGCPYSLYAETGMVHAIGRCIFGSLYNESVFNDGFFRSLFRPNHNYSFNSSDVSIRKTCDSYMVLFSEAAGRDLSDFMKNKIKGNCSASLEEAKIGLGFS